MKAELLLRRRVVYDHRTFAEFVVWRVPEHVPPSPHGSKYRLVYVVDGARVIGFDNERGKGDHRHDGGRERTYVFRDVDTLIEDFVSAIERWRSGLDQT